MNKEKIEIEVDEDLGYGKFGVSYRVDFAKYYDHQDYEGYYWITHDPEVDYQEGATIEELYEKMAQELVKWQLRHDNEKMADPTIEFGPITVAVEKFSQERLKATKTYQGIALARELKKKKEEEEQLARKAREAEKRRLEKEKREKSEYERLKKKFEP
jgi:hypothetical protein